LGDPGGDGVGKLGRLSEYSGFVPDGTCCVYTGTEYSKILVCGCLGVKLEKITENSELRIRRIRGLCRPQLGEFGFCAVWEAFKGGKRGKFSRKLSLDRQGVAGR